MESGQSLKCLAGKEIKAKAIFSGSNIKTYENVFFRKQ